MNLQDLIDQLTALQPASARDATVMIGCKDEETLLLSVRYSGGVVTLEAEDLNVSSYDDGYEDGKRDGKREAEDDD